MRVLLATLLVVALCPVHAQDHAAEIRKTITLSKTKAQVEFLAADEMKGRNTGTPELDIAANYIASLFKRSGLKPAGGTDWFQRIAFTRITAPSTGVLKITDRPLLLGKDFAYINGADIDVNAGLVYAGYGSEEDFKAVDVKGKIVVVIFGQKDDPSLMKALNSTARSKNERASAAGAVAMIEVITTPGVPFPAMVNFLHKERMMVSSGEKQVPQIVLQPPTPEFINLLKTSNGLSGSLQMKGIRTTSAGSRNVIGMVEGTDPILKKQFVVLSAHYDHVGTGTPTAENDSIFNGARDNALGTVALLSAAEYIGAHPPKRSVLFIALTAEEQGLLGSAYYVDHPVVPLRDCVFNLNSDGGGYNDKSIITINGFEYTDSRQLAESASAPFEVTAKEDPVPAQDLYSMSDNYSFAKKGIPAINMAPGINAFDAEIMKYYHKQDDEIETIDFEYVLKYFQAYTHTAVTLANVAKLPWWLPGSRFEKTGKELYNR